MAHRSSRGAFQALQALAHDQAGYVTARQAARLGYAYSHLTYHIGAGNLERAGHGLYRVLGAPLSQHDDLVRLSFWSRDRSGTPRAVVSHHTALVLHELTELLPGTTHLTVPRRFRKPPPRGCRLHRAELAAADVEARDGFLVTRPTRTLLDAAGSDVPFDELAKAVHVALERGSVRRAALLAAARGSPGEERIVRALSQPRAKEA
jgi:predicted transcriptional regulator of viral defense system